MGGRRSQVWGWQRGGRVRLGVGRLGGGCGPEVTKGRRLACGAGRWGVGVLLLLGVVWAGPSWSQSGGGSGGRGAAKAVGEERSAAVERTLAEVLAELLVLQAQARSSGGVGLETLGGDSAAVVLADSATLRPRTLAAALAAAMGGGSGVDGSVSRSVATALAVLAADSSLQAGAGGGGDSGVGGDSTGGQWMPAAIGFGGAAGRGPGAGAGSVAAGGRGGLAGVRALLDSVLGDTVRPSAALLGELRVGFNPALPVFGLSLFGDQPRPAAGWQRVPITPFYQLGPGDVIQVKCWGAFDLDLELPVADDGSIQMPGGDLVYVNGLTFGQLEGLVLRELRRYHAEALTAAKLESRQVLLEVSLAAVRGVQVLVTGQVGQPGGVYVRQSERVVDGRAGAGGGDHQPGVVAGGAGASGGAGAGAGFV